MKKNDFTLIYSTCDDYNFLWKDFFDIFYKKWPDFDRQIISTGTKSVLGHPEVKTIKSIQKSFSSRLIKALKKSKTEFVLLFLDDFFLTKAVKIDLFYKALEVMKNDNDIVCITLFDHPQEKEYKLRDYNDLFVVKRNDVRYSVTTQVSLWKKSYLIKLLHRGENAWEFEKLAPVRHRYYNKTVLYRKDSVSDIFSYPEGGVFQKGKLRNTPDVIKLVEEENIDETKYVVPLKPKKVVRFWRLRTCYKNFYLKHHVKISWLPFFK